MTEHQELLFDQVLGEARRDLDPMTLAWRKMMHEEVCMHLTTHNLYHNLQLADGIVAYNGCSIEKATNKILCPDLYWNPEEDIL
jgi:hypothetical protein